MSKYIDLELALNELLRLYEEDVDAYGVEIPETFDYRRAREALSDLPTIDIVRCKDCNHWFDDSSKCTKWTTDTYEQAQTNADDFCSYGERSDNE